MCNILPDFMDRGEATKHAGNVYAQRSMNREIQGSFLENCNQVTKHHSFWTQAVSPGFQVFLIDSFPGLLLYDMQMQWVIMLLIKLLLQQEKHMCDLWWRFRLNNARMCKHTHVALMFFCSFLIRTQHFVSLPMTAHNKNDCCCDLFWMALLDEKRSIGGAKDQFIRNYKHCSAASYGCGIF